MADFQRVMRRIVTGDNERGKSTIILDGGPSSSLGDPDFGGLFEIWEEAITGALDPRATKDLGGATPKLGPRAGNFQVRWFVVHPSPDGVPRDVLNSVARDSFAAVGGAEHIIDQSRHPSMHETHTVDVICLVQGSVKLILEDTETILSPGQVVIQRGTNHAWEPIGGPALLLAVLIDRSDAR